MPEQSLTSERARMLADVAEMYYLEEMNQEQISRRIGLTRSMVSRLLSEARHRGLVEIHIHWPLEIDHDLGNQLVDKYKIFTAQVVTLPSNDDPRLLKYLGRAGAQVLKDFLKPKMVLGIAWGTSISAVADEVDDQVVGGIKIVQLVGALGSRNVEYDGHGLVTRLAEKLVGEAYYLNAPFLCQDRETAASLMETKTIREAVALGSKADIALLGVGSTNPKYSSFYLANYVPLEKIQELREMGSVGDVCGLHFNILGKISCEDFCDRLVTIHVEDLLAIPVRIGVAGGPGKVESIVGALRGGFVNVLVTDSITARKVIAYDEK